MKLSKSGVRAVLALAAIGMAIFGPGSVAQARPDVSRDLLRPGVLIVGTDSPYPPFEFGRPRHYRGFDIDLVNAMARKLRLRVRYRDTAFDTIFTDLRRRKFDLVASATTITPERRRYVAFSRPYYESLQSMVVRRRSPIRALRDLRGVRVGVQNGTTGEYFARDATNAKVIRFSTGFGAIRAVRTGRVRATIIDQPIAVDFLRRSPRGLRIARNYSTGEKYGFAINKFTPRLRRGINWALRRIKADGSFRRIYRKWFGVNPPPSL